MLLDILLLNDNDLLILLLNGLGISRGVIGQVCYGEETIQEADHEFYLC